MSRVTDPQNFELIGLPPADMLEEVARAWRDAGLDVDQCFEEAVRVTDEWKYERTQPGADPCTRVQQRLTTKWKQSQHIPVKLRRLEDIISP